MLYIAEIQQVYPPNISYNGSTSSITDAVSHGRLNDSNYSEASSECVLNAQTKHSLILYDSKVDDRTSSIRLSIFILGGLCIVMILLHLSFSVIIRNILQIEPFCIQTEERYNNFR